MADLTFWSLAGAAVAALAGPLADWWGAPRAVLLAGGLAFLVGGVGALFGLNLLRPVPRRMARGFGMFNLVFAPLVWATALYGWLGLSAAGTGALVVAGGVALALGVWQLSTVHPLRPSALPH